MRLNTHIQKIGSKMLKYSNSTVTVIIVLHSEGDQPAKQKKKKKTVATVGKKVNTTNVKTDVMQSGLVRLYMVDIPHFGKQFIIFVWVCVGMCNTAFEFF